MKQTAPNLNLRLNGQLDNCLACKKGKIKRRRINRETNWSDHPIGHKAAIDISYIKNTSISGFRYCNLIHDYGKWLCHILEA